MPLPPPPLDADGLIKPYDEPAISNGDRIIRRISTYHIVEDVSGRRRISSMAYQESSLPSYGMSVDLEELIKEDGIDPKVWVAGDDWPGSVFFTAGDLRAEGLQIGADPLPSNPYHGEVWGITDGKKRKLRKMAAWYVEIQDVSLT